MPFLLPGFTDAKRALAELDLGSNDFPPAGNPDFVSFISLKSTDRVRERLPRADGRVQATE